MPWMPLILIIDKRKDDVTLGAAALQKQNSCTEPNYQRTLNAEGCCNPGIEKERLQDYQTEKDAVGCDS